MAIQKFDPNRRSTFIGNSAYRPVLSNDDQTAQGQDFGSNVWQGVLGTELLTGKVGYVEFTMPAPAGASAGFATDAFDYVINGGNYSVGTGAASWGLIGDAGGASVSYAGNDSLQWAGPVVSPGQTFGLIYHDSGRTWLVLPSGQIAHKPDGGGVGAVDYTPPTFDAAGNLTGGGVGTPTGISGPVRFGASAPRGQQMNVNADGPFALAAYLPANVAGWNAAATPAGIAASAIVALDPVLGGGGGQLALRATAAAGLASIGAGASGRLAVAGTTIGALGPVRVAATGRPRIGASAAGRLGPVGVGGAAALAIAGRALSTMGAISATAAGGVLVTANSGLTLDPVILTAAGASQPLASGAVSGVLSPITASAAATLAIGATIASSLAAVVSTGNATLLLRSQVNHTLPPIQTAAASRLAIGATSAAQLSPVTATISGAGLVAAEARLFGTLEPIAAQGHGGLVIATTATAALAPVTAAAIGLLRIDGQAGAAIAPIAATAMATTSGVGRVVVSLAPIGLLAVASSTTAIFTLPALARTVRARPRQRMVAAPVRIRFVTVKGRAC